MKTQSPYLILQLVFMAGNWLAWQGMAEPGPAGSADCKAPFFPLWPPLSYRAPEGTCRWLLVCSEQEQSVDPFDDHRLSIKHHICLPWPFFFFFFFWKVTPSLNPWQIQLVEAHENLCCFTQKHLMNGNCENHDNAIIKPYCNNRSFMRFDFFKI